MHPFKVECISYGMFGWVRKRPKDTPDTGLMYAGATTTPPQRQKTTQAVQEQTVQEQTAQGQAVQESIQTEDGSLELYSSYLRLINEKGIITVLYNTIDAWDYDGKVFRLWYTEGNRNYIMTCRPQTNPEEHLYNTIHDAMYKT